MAELGNMESVMDEYKNIHYLKEKLSSGGQGSVFTTRDPNILIKIESENQNKNITRERQIKQAHDKFEAVRLMPLPQHFPLARPIAVLDGVPGYVMEFLQDMEPMESYFKYGNEGEAKDLPGWLDSVPDNRIKKQFFHYMKSGGLRRRLRALGKFAAILARLHLRGIVYGDISPNNVFVSSYGMNEDNVWLIDADNLSLATQNEKAAFFTPGYGAPEVVRGGSASFFSDDYSFAVLAFYVITMQMPFDGCMLEDAGWDTDDGDDVAQKASLGELPWIDDEDDDSNCDETVMTALRPMLLNNELRRLFQRTFGEEGRHCPMKRPTAMTWARALMRAADGLVHCDGCGMDYYAGAGLKSACPYCDNEHESVAVLEVMRSGATSSTDDEMAYHIESLCEDIPSRILRPMMLDRIDEGIMRLVKKERNRIVLQKEKIGRDKLLWGTDTSSSSFKNINSLDVSGIAGSDEPIYLASGKSPAWIVRFRLKAGE